MDKTSLGDRMKNNYEVRSRTFLTRRTPVILRLDGKAFHTFTKSFEKPFSELMNEAMRHTTKKLCEQIQGAKLAYTQSDEITILLTDYDKLTTDAWFNYNVQKMCSVAASIASAEFNKFMLLEYFKEKSRTQYFGLSFGEYPSVDIDKDIIKYIENNRLAVFDCRSFNIPREEVCNNFVWRQQDWIRNSMQMLAQSLYSHKELHGKNQKDMHEMCFQKGHNWAKLEDKWKNGNTCIKSDNEWTFIEGVIFQKDHTIINNLVNNKDYE